MNPRHFIDAMARESANIATLIELGNQAARASFVADEGHAADGTGKLHSHAAAMLHDLANQQMQTAAAALAAMSRKVGDAAAAPPFDPGVAADPLVVDVDAVEVVATPARGGA